MRVPLLVAPVLPSGSLNTRFQPTLHLDARLTARPWRVDDATMVRAAFDCPAIQRWHVRRIDTDDEALDWIVSWAVRWTAETDASWAITANGRPIGQVGLRTVSLFEGSAQLSYWVLPSERGGGVAGMAVRAVTAWAFDELRLNRLFLMHSTLNTQSCRVAEKTGFELEGTHRRSMLHTDGWHDVHVHAQLNQGQLDQGLRATAT